MANKDRWVRRFSVDETAKHKNGFTIYKITSVLFPIQSPEALTVVSVWKRYSDVQRLHKGMKALHAGLHLRGTFPILPRYSYFKRFQKEVVADRAKSIKTLLEFIADHRLLFTSTEFVDFLQTGYPEPESSSTGVTNAMRTTLQLPLEANVPLECHTSDDDVSPTRNARNCQQNNNSTIDNMEISQIPIYQPLNVERRSTSKSDSFESLNSLDSIKSDLFDALDRITIDNKQKSVKKTILPDLINFEASTSELRSNTDSDSISDRGSRMSMSNRSIMSLSNVESKTKTEDSYVFEAGYMLNLAARCEQMGDYPRAFECYKSGIEKMLVGAQKDSDPERRALIKQKINKYLTYAETIFKNHLCNTEVGLVEEMSSNRAIHCPLPVSMLSKPYAALAQYKVLGVLGASIMLVLDTEQQACYAMKVIQKIPKNLTEFDEYFLQHTEETRKPLLPTNIPYMVPIHAYIETNNLIFLILAYAPGKKLLDYIKNYAESIPSTPVREVNLENVFTEPKIEETIEYIDSIDEVDTSVNELVVNSQRLMSDVDKVLKSGDKLVQCDNKVINNESPISKRPKPSLRNILPPSTVCKWGAEILTALESLHNCGVICRDLNPSNILLSNCGQIVLTYFVGYTGIDMGLSITRTKQSGINMYVAPELYVNTIVDADKDQSLEHVCDYWSFGVIMYQLLCGVPLSHYHRSMVTSHTILVMPEELSIEEKSLLSQLLTYEPSERLGAGKDGVDEIKRHPYFKNIDWMDIYDSWIVPG